MTARGSAGRRVLVTGGTGVIGRQALPQLVLRGWEVHATTTSAAPPDVVGVRWHRADLLAPGTAAGVIGTVQPDALLHLAWYVAPGQWAAAPENLEWVGATIALVRAFRERGGHRFVGAGSGLEYDWGYGYCSERRTPCAPHTLYGTAKHATRLLLESYATRSGLSMAWGRVFFLFGPHEHPVRLIPAVIRSLLQGEPARCSHGRQVRDYLFSVDVADALVTLLESELTGPINIASGEPITLRALASRAGELMGRETMIEFGAIPAASTDAPLVVADVTRLREELQWSPRYTRDEGLKATIAWWQQELTSSATPTS